MANIELMLLPLLLNTSSITEVVQDVIHVKNIICPQFKNVVLYGYQSNEELSSISNELLKRANFSAILNPGRRLQTDKCAIIFTEQPDVTSNDIWSIASPFRGIIVTSSAALMLLSSYQRYSFVYVLYDDDVYRFGFYNRFRRQFYQMSQLESDPVVEAQLNLFGWRILIFPTNNEHYIMETAAALRNASYRIGMTPEISTVLTHTDLPSMDQASNNIALRTVAILCFIVPRSKVKPLITILSDPFDETSWIFYFLSAILIAFFEVLLSNRRKHLLSGIEKVVYLLWMALTGSEVRVNHEMSRWTTAIWLLMNVILVSAYQSLIISFLQQPRYYSEFKTLQQMNDSCCWVRSYTADLASYDLYQNFPCDEKIDFFNLKLEELQNHNYCILEMCVMVEEFLEVEPKIAQHYRVDQGPVGSFYPVLLNIKFHSPIYELLKFYIDGFIQGDLTKYKLLKDEQTKASRAKFFAIHLDGDVVKAITVDDLSLSGFVLAGGAIIGVLSFVVEYIFSKTRHWRIAKKSGLFLRKIKLI